MKDKWRYTLKQAEFCEELMTRLNFEIHGAKESIYKWGDGYTKMQADVIRLRRELNTLRKMLNPWEVQGWK